MDENRPAPEGTTRRAALRAGAAVAWSVPVVTVLGTSAAHADLASGPGGGGTVPPPGGGTETPPPPGTETPGQSVQPTGGATTGGPTTTAPAGGAVQGGATQTPAVAGAAARPTSSPAVAAAPAARGGAAELAKTGAEALPLGVAGLGLVVGGAAAVAASRRLGTDDPSA